MSTHNAPARIAPTASTTGRHSAQADRGQSDPTSTLLARAYGRILERWACPDCGQVGFPCPCDLADTKPAGKGHHEPA